MKMFIDMSAHELYEWVKNNMSSIFDPVECAEWFLHSYGSNDFDKDGDVPDWGQLAYRAELLANMRRHGVTVMGAD